MPRVVHFEFTAHDPDRAIKFYKDVFGWTFNKWEGPEEYWLVNTGEKSEPGIDGGMLRRPPEGGTTVNTIEVRSVDDYIKKATRSGGQITMPKSAIPGVGYVAYCKDTEGNVFGIFQTDENAK